MIEQWLHWLEQQQAITTNFQDLIPLKNVATTLGVLDFSCPTFTVTGTNGKGSCVRILETIYVSAGYRVGTYTSPHLLQYNERIRINGKVVSEEELCAVFPKIQAAISTQSFSYFAISTLLALTIFKRHDLDVLILEVGVGGRLDPTNILDADVAVITSIDLDHTQWLGITRDAIAVEKAGIFRTGHPAVIGDSNPPHSLKIYAEELKTPLYIREQDFRVDIADSYWTWRSQQNCLKDLIWPTLFIDNAATALQVVELLHARLVVSYHDILAGLKINLAGRYQLLADSTVPTWIDVAHNPEACKQLAKYLHRDDRGEQVLAVFSMLQDKDIAACISALKESVDKWFIAGLPYQRGVTSAAIKNIFAELNVNEYVCCDSVSEAYRAAQAEALINNSSKIIAFGSFCTVAEVINIVKSFNRGVCDYQH